MVGLVLDAPGEQSTAFDNDRVSVHVLTARNHLLAARTIHGHAGYRQTAFGPVLILIARKDKDRINEVPGFGIVVDVVREHSEADT
jgi:hypothetical protein